MSFSSENILDNKKRQKVHLHVLISEDIYRKLIEIAPLVYGQKRYRGALSYIVEQALAFYLSEVLHTQNAQKVNPRGSVQKV